MHLKGLSATVQQSTKFKELSKFLSDKSDLACSKAWCSVKGNKLLKHKRSGVLGELAPSLQTAALLIQIYKDITKKRLALGIYMYNRNNTRLAPAQ